MSTYIGRQPIFDQFGECFAYELLYRSCDIINNANFECNMHATTKVIANLIHNFGLNPIIGNKIGYVNVDESMLFSDTILLLPKEYLKFEILEHTKVTLALLERIKYLHALGYRFSLDDFDCKDITIKNFELIFPYIEIIKIDILAIGVENLEKAIAKLEKYPITLLAEKIETPEVYALCKTLNFKFFQGYFFEKPLILSNQKIEPHTISVVRLINDLQENDSIQDIAKKFSSCPDLIFNLLRHINSGAYHFKQQINNIQQMVSLLGQAKLMSWLGLFLYGDPRQKPFGEELFNNAKFRAKVMEELALTSGDTKLANKAFLVGSLSLIDAYLGIAMESFLENLSLDDEIKVALLKENGVIGELLYYAKVINHSNDIEHTIAAFEENSRFTKEQFYNASCKATVFLEEFRTNY